ncbi:Putative ubiquinone biosynthesis monooxygenase [Malassezia obtusa]|uniref:Ubiquinone biosynthesis monooxygenase n=1 Tax=Malassezia obtusa TaxID=76774 RepID=A0AAF0E1G4_9BASI|nr:Putative ubiquinone biosynthesis monooxygenase [Malassezia obtusa]
MRAVRAVRTAHTASDADVVIVGGGVVGLAMLAGLVTNRAMPSMRVALVDAMDLSRFATWRDAKAATTRAPTPQHDGIAWENRVISMNMDNLAWMQGAYAATHAELGADAYLDAARMRNVERIRVWDGLSDAAAEFGPGAPPSGALSVMVEIANVQQALYRLIEARAADPACRVRVEILGETRVGAIEAPDRDAWPTVSLEDARGARQIRTRLLVGADGHNSPVRRFAGIESFGWPYDRKGLVATMRTGRAAHSAEPCVDASAWQRFLPTGTLACLPLSASAGTIVWTLPPALADALGALHRADAAHSDEPALLAALITAGFRLPWAPLEALLHRAEALARTDAPDTSALHAAVVEALAHAEQALGGAAPSAHLGTVPPAGDAVDVRSVASFPLQLKHAGCYLGSTLNRRLHDGLLPAPSTLLTGVLTALQLTPGGAARGAGQARTVLVGDAAHTTHPLSGQGLNLGIQDVRALSGALADAAQQGLDLGTDAALRPYEAARYVPNQAMLSLTDHLHWLFAPRPASAVAPAPGAAGAVREAALRALVWARSTGLDVVNELGPLKQLLVQGAGSRRA